jgi:geranylgeranyl reductase family protein
MEARQERFNLSNHATSSADAGNTQWQLPLAQVARTNWDVVVVGAGPAGAMTALHLARAGCDVLLLDRCRFPRVKVCGEGLIADGLGALQRAGLLDEVLAEGHTLDRATIYSPSLYAFDVPGHYVTIGRAMLDAMVARRAAELGATFCQGQLVAVRTSLNGGIILHVAGEPRPIETGVLVLATGAQTHLARKVGLCDGAETAAAAIRGYVRATAGPDCLLGFYGRELAPGYGWVFPMGGNVYNVGVVQFRGLNKPVRGTADWRPDRSCQNDLRRAYEGFVRAFPPARALLAAAQSVVPPTGAAIRWGLRSAALQLGRVLAVGETAGTTLPFTAEGIGKAMQSGELAASVIIKALERRDLDLLREYPERLMGELGLRYRQYERAQAWLTTPWLNDFMARRAARSPLLRQQLAGILTESCEPRAVFSLAGVVRSVLGFAVPARLQ